MKNNFGYRVLTPLMRFLFKLYYNPKIINKEFIPKDGSIIIACNHKHLFDQCLTIMATKRPINYMAKKEYFDGIFSHFFKFVGCISVDRSKKDENSKIRALSILNNGGVIGIFPEGTRNRNKKKVLLNFKFGAASLAKKSDSFIVPCAVTGDYKFRSKNLMIQYGEPFKVDDIVKGNERLYKAIEDLIYDNLKKSNRSLEDELDTHFV